MILGTICVDIGSFGVSSMTDIRMFSLAVVMCCFGMFILTIGQRHSSHFHESSFTLDSYTLAEIDKLMSRALDKGDVSNQAHDHHHHLDHHNEHYNYEPDLYGCDSNATPTTTRTTTTSPNSNNITRDEYNDHHRVKFTPFNHYIGVHANLNKQDRMANYGTMDVSTNVVPNIMLNWNYSMRDSINNTNSHKKFTTNGTNDDNTTGNAIIENRKQSFLQSKNASSVTSTSNRSINDAVVVVPSNRTATHGYIDNHMDTSHSYRVRPKQTDMSVDVPSFESTDISV